MTAGNCDDPDVWGLTGPETVVATAKDCASEAARTVVNFALKCPRVASAPETHALRAKCNSIISENVGNHVTRMAGHATAHVVVDAAWILITIALYVRKLGAVFGDQTPDDRVVPPQLAAAVSALAVISTITPLRDGSCFRSYVDGSSDHNGDGFIPHVDMDTAAGLLWAALAVAAIPLYAEASSTVKPAVGAVGYAVAWSLNYVAALENGRDVCDTTHQGVGTATAKIVMTMIAALMTLSDLKAPAHKTWKNAPARKQRHNAYGLPQSMPPTKPFRSGVM